MDVYHGIVLVYDGIIIGLHEYWSIYYHRLVFAFDMIVSLDNIVFSETVLCASDTDIL